MTLEPTSRLGSWLEDVETQARHQFSQHNNITGALSLVVPDIVWNIVPGNNITNVAGLPTNGVIYSPGTLLGNDKENFGSLAG